MSDSEEKVARDRWLGTHAAGLALRWLSDLAQSAARLSIARVPANRLTKGSGGVGRIAPHEQDVASEHRHPGGRRKVLFVQPENRQGIVVSSGATETERCNVQRGFAEIISVTAVIACA